MPHSTAKRSPYVEALYRSHHSWLVHWLCRRTSCSHESADLAQDTFLRLLQREKLEPLKEPRSYLASVARGLLIDKYRRQTIEQAYLNALSQQAPAHVPSLEQQALILESLVLVDRCLQKLPRRSREIFLLARIDGMNNTQIAQHTGLSLSTVKNHLYTATLHCLQWDFRL